MKPSKTAKLIEFRKNAEKIQKHADKNCRCNFTKATNELVEKGMKSNKRPYLPKQKSKEAYTVAHSVTYGEFVRWWDDQKEPAVHVNSNKPPRN
tara:strand:+ start:2029 stop:2310 length:282 start_codon:yes stop_codon:yes gene_type:complete